MSRKVTRMAAGFVSVDNETLQKVLADFKKNGRTRVHVGVLGGFDSRSDDGPGNAEIGAAHEFGVVSHNLPARSFLRMPVINELPPALKATDRELWHKAIVKEGIRGALALLGAYALDVIHLAFETGGFGFWQALKPATIRRKLKKGRGSGSTTILIDTAQLRQAITAELVDAK